MTDPPELSIAIDLISCFRTALSENTIDNVYNMIMYIFDNPIIDGALKAIYNHAIKSTHETFLIAVIDLDFYINFAYLKVSPSDKIQEWIAFIKDASSEAKRKLY